ncbi:hypothetical protein BY996DRAFT_4565381, partial [Phakopsora pachyrhizi]
PFLYNFGQKIAPSPLDWFEWVHITGYWFLDKGMKSNDQDGEKRKNGLMQLIEKANNEGKKIVYIGFGSIVVPNPKEMTRNMVEAKEKADFYAIVTKGWSDQ